MLSVTLIENFTPTTSVTTAISSECTKVRLPWLLGKDEQQLTASDTQSRKQQFCANSEHVTPQIDKVKPTVLMGIGLGKNGV